MALKYQMAIKSTKIFIFKGLQNYTKFGIFGMQTYRLATLFSIQ
jgi:hypothetical protein